MKQCPHCKKNIPDSAKVCPHCGTRLEKGYQPMKRTNTFPNYLYGILALVLIFSPLISSMLFGNFLGDGTASNTVTTPDKAITLGPLGEVNINKEVTEYQFGSLKDFDKLVTNSDSYVKKIKQLENDLTAITDKYGKTTIDKDYDFYVTDQNNVYTSLNYDLKIGKNETMSISFSYDLSGTTNAVNIGYTINGFKDFEAMKINEQSYPMLNEIVKLINGDDMYVSFNKAGEKFNQLENDFNERNESIGNYGIGITQSEDDTKVSMRILSSEDGYRLKITYKTKADMNKLVGNSKGTE